ncbi:MAG: DnaB-like helicase N-terminal domain-containing protein [Candidatus Omnitrophica bacterium]|nr:DnaB-like helicase N-terminal domain-containing protein [Candidatus Omnitrophota bacterium]
MNKDDSALPPQDLLAESASLGSMILLPEAITEGRKILKEHYFYRESHKIIYKSIMDIDSSGKPVDLVTLREFIDRVYGLDKIGGVLTLTTLLDETPTPSNYKSYFDIVYRKYLAREGIDFCHKLIAKCQAEDQKVVDFVKTAIEEYEKEGLNVTK